MTISSGSTRSYSSNSTQKVSDKYHLGFYFWWYPELKGRAAKPLWIPASLPQEIGLNECLQTEGNYLMLPKLDSIYINYVSFWKIRYYLVQHSIYWQEDLLFQSNRLWTHCIDQQTASHYQWRTLHHFQGDDDYDTPLALSFTHFYNFSITQCSTFEAVICPQ